MKSFNGAFKKLMLGTSVLAAAVLGGCLMTDGGKSSEAGGTANLLISTKIRDVNSLSKPGLGKTAAAVPTGIVLNKLIVTLTSSNPNDSVIRDTIVASDTSGSIFETSSSSSQQVFKDYSVRALRTWAVEVKTLDINDSVVHSAMDTTAVVGVGQSVPVILNLSSRFVVYVAKFLLPDSIGSADTSITLKQALNIKRFVMVIDGDTVRDTSASPNYFAPSPTENFVTWNYVSTLTDTHSVELYVYTDSLGGMDNWDESLPLFADTILVTDIDSVYSPEIPYTGPGSSSDPACQANPSNCGGGQVGLDITIGPVEMVEIAPIVNPNPLPRRKD